MGKKSDAPPAPDYRAAAEETAQGNLELLNAQTQANRPTQVTPFGTIDWSNNNGNWTQTVSLTPQQQASLDAQMGVQTSRSELARSMIDRMSGEFGDPMDWSQFTEYAGPLGDGSATRNRVEDAYYRRAQARLNPQFDEGERSMEYTLRARGLRPGMEAYEREKRRFARNKEDAYAQAMDRAILAGGSEASREQGMDLTAANYINTLRNAQIADAQRRRGFSLNEMNALLTGQQVATPSAPSFVGAGRASGPDYTGAARDTYSANVDAFNAEQARWNALFGGASDLASAFMGRG